MEQNAIDQFRDLMGTADKLRDYKNVETALDETNTRLKGAQSDLNAASRGWRRTLFDQNTAVAYRGAVTGSGGTVQNVWCSGAAWLQD